MPNTLIHVNIGTNFRHIQHRVACIPPFSLLTSVCCPYNARLFASESGAPGIMGRSARGDEVFRRMYPEEHLRQAGGGSGIGRLPVSQHLHTASMCSPSNSLTLKVAVFWVVTSCCLVVYQRFRSACCLPHEGDGSSKHFRKVCKISTRLHDVTSNKAVIFQ
jgi:hypothetical protein